MMCYHVLLCCVYPGMSQWFKCLDDVLPCTTCVVGMSQWCECLYDVLPRTTCVVCIQVCLSGSSVWMMCYHVLPVLCVSRYVSVVGVFV